MKLIARLSKGSLLGALLLFPAVSLDADFPPGGDDITFSLGSFRIKIDPAFQGLFVGYPGYDGVSRLNSPVLFDPGTVIGRSDPFDHGSPEDQNGVPVGSALTPIADSSFSLVPNGFQGPNGTREVHTEVRSLNMTSFGAAVRAGIWAPLRPVSPGEVESLPGDASLDFPAQSFFDIFVEVDLPAFGAFAGATLYNDNSHPLLVENSSLESFPPTVVYIHGNSRPVPILFLNDGPDWSAGDLLGNLVLAGHGIGFTDSQSDVAKFQAIMAQQKELVPDGGPGLLGIFAVAAAVLVGTRKRTPADHAV